MELLIFGLNLTSQTENTKNGMVEIKILKCKLNKPITNIKPKRTPIKDVPTTINLPDGFF